MKKNNNGFTLVEMVVIVGIFSALLAMIVPSLNSILLFRGQRAAGSITSALDKTKVEAMNRLVGEMELSKESDGYYITYYLDRGRGGTNVKEDQREKIAPGNVRIFYTTVPKAGGDLSGEIPLEEGKPLILTFYRETGAFRPIQSEVLTQSLIDADLKAGKDVQFRDTNEYCESIIVRSGARTRTIKLIRETGNYEER